MNINTGCLFLIFNRPDITEKVFDVIRQMKPKKLYIAGDGPRKNYGDDIEKIEKTREIIKKIDWDCNLRVLFQDHNLGCKKAVSKAIAWFFEYEDEGIIIEDDCLPSCSFFYFCEELLEKYRHDNRIMAISGDNFQNGRSRDRYSYYFSVYPHVWGWATWRRAWKYWDGELSSWPYAREDDLLNSIFCKEKMLVKLWTDIFNSCYEGKIDTWDYQWIYSCFIQNGLTILPKVNLVSNIGFRPDATHTLNRYDAHANLPLHDMKFPLQHPFYVMRNTIYDRNIGAYLLKDKGGCFYRLKKLTERLF